MEQLDKTILLQKQVKDNSEDLQAEFLDMRNWEEQMKRKDQELLNEHNTQENFPPIRKKKQKSSAKSKLQQKENVTKSKRIKSYDYSAWDQFDVDKACKEVDKEDQSDESGDELLSKEELEKNHDEATKHKEQGNIYVRQQQWAKAVSCYNEAIKLFPYDAVFYANRALCQLKLDNLYSAEADCSAAIQLDGMYVKAYLRRATARIALKQYKEAKQDVEKILQLEPSNKEAKSLLNQINRHIENSKPVIITGENLDDDIPIQKKIGQKMWSNSEMEFQKNKEQGNVNKKQTDEGERADMKQGEKNVEKKELDDSRQKERSNKLSAVKKQPEIDLSIPEWLPEKDVVVIEARVVPPHLRSKEPLIAIPVQEADLTTMNLNKKIEINESQQHADLQKVYTKSTPEKSTGFVEMAESHEEGFHIPPVPKTAVQFLTDWRRSKDTKYRYKYLKQFQSGSLPKILQDSMESDVFSDILKVLQIEFTKYKEPVFQILEDLSQVKRFRALIMFISKAGKEGLRELFKYCSETEKVCEEDMQKLRTIYEI